MMKISRITKLMFLIFVLFSLSACASQRHMAGGSPYYSDGVEGRLIIKTASLEIKVDNIKLLEGQLKSIVTTTKGYVVSNDLDSENRFYATVMIPTEKLEKTIGEISSLGKEVSRSIRSSDVTEEFIDKDAELNNLLSLRNRMQELLLKAVTVDEILNVEKELNRIQTRIDAINGRLKSLKNQVAFSELSIRGTEKRIYGPRGYLGIGIAWVFEKLFIIK